MPRTDLLPNFRWLMLGLVLLAFAPMGRAAGQASTAGDAFGTRIGTESIGLYSESLVRGSDLQQAGNYLLGNAYLVRAGSPPDTIVQGSRIRVGPNALDVAFPAPSGMVQYALLPGDDDRLRIEAGFQHLLDANPRPYARAHFAKRSTDGNFSLAGGVLGSPSARYIYGNEARYSGFGLVPRLRMGRWNATGIYGVYQQRYQADVGFEPVGDRLPEPDRLDYMGQPWSRYRTKNTTRGIVLETETGKGAWGYSLSAIQSLVDRPRSDFNVFTDVAMDGRAEGAVVIAQHRNVDSTGLEARAVREFGNGRHSGLLTLVGRDRDSEYARPHVQHLSLGRTDVFGPIAAVPEPELAKGPQGWWRVGQRELGVALQLAWANGRAFNVSVRDAQLEESAEVPGTRSSRSSRDWLYSASAVVPLSDRATAFASVVRGIEEAGVAPQNASNAFQILSPTLARQAELGFKWQSAPATIIGTLFELSKAEPGFDAQGSFDHVALARHRGLELSASTSPTADLRILLGASWMRARLEGDAVEQGVMGNRAVGRSEHLLLGSAEYQPSSQPVWSFDVDATYSGPRAADTRAAVSTAGYTLVNAGLRYRFPLGSWPAFVRLRVYNVTDRYGWHADSSGMQSYEPSRRVVLSLTLGE